MSSTLYDFFGKGDLGAATNKNFLPSSVAQVEAEPFSNDPTYFSLSTEFTVTNNIGSLSDLNPQDHVDDVTNTNTSVFREAATYFNNAPEVTWTDMTVGGSTLPIVFGIVRGLEQGTTNTYLVQYILGANTSTGTGQPSNEWRVFTTGSSLDVYDANGIPLANPNFVGNKGQGNFTGPVSFNVAPCFTPGALIRTDAGEVPVETLSVGDHVVTIDGALAPVIWIGKWHVDCRSRPRPDDVSPILIARGALGDGVPTRDLMLSPDHALLLDGVLVSAKFLVNGTTIVRIPKSEVTYIHFELPRHDCVFAEGAHAETYLYPGIDGPNRSRQFPEDCSWEMVSRIHEAKLYAPRVVTGPRLQSIRDRLEIIATQLSPALEAV